NPQPAAPGLAGPSLAAPTEATPQAPGSWLLAKSEPPDLNFFHFSRKSGGLDEQRSSPTGQFDAVSGPSSTARPGIAGTDDEKSMSDDTAVDSASEASTLVSSGPDSPGGQSGGGDDCADNGGGGDNGPAATSWRNFFTAVNLLRTLQKLTKGKTQRVQSLVQWKASAVLKRVLKVSHPALQLYCYKLMKSQVPYMGRKWKGNNTKIITGIYLHLRPNLKEEYLSGDLDIDAEEALAQEQHLRSLVAFYHHVQFPDHFPSLAQAGGSAGGDAGGDGQDESPTGSNGGGAPTDTAGGRRKQPGAAAAFARDQTTDHDELELLLASVRRSMDEQQQQDRAAVTAAATAAGVAVVQEPATAPAALLPIGRNRYSAAAEAVSLDESFAANYEAWLEDEVFGPRIVVAGGDELDELTAAAAAAAAGSLPYYVAQMDAAGLSSEFDEHV
ncbi:Factor arrest protein 11, partial [Cladochytrium tenue]